MRVACRRALQQYLLFNVGDFTLDLMREKFAHSHPKTLSLLFLWVRDASARIRIQQTAQMCRESRVSA